METIYKYPIETTDYQKIELPLNSIILSVVTIEEKLFLYANIDSDEQQKISVEINIYGTGHQIKSELYSKWRFMGTFPTFGGQLVWHVFISKLQVLKNDSTNR